MNQSKIVFAAESAYKEHMEFFFNVPKAIPLQVLVNMHKYGALELLGGKKELGKNEYCSSYLTRSVTAKELIKTLHGWRLKAIVETYYIYEYGYGGMQINYSGHPTGSNWHEESSYTHFFEISDKDVNTLKNHFPDIWDKL